MLSFLTKPNSYNIHLDVNGTDVVKPAEVAEVFAQHLQSVYNTILRWVSTPVNIPVIVCSCLPFLN
jgi:hypothetical protein